MAKQERRGSETTFYLGYVDLIRLLAVVLILPSSVMSISFLLAAKAPPLVAGLLFSLGMLLMGYRSQILFFAAKKQALVEYRTWGIRFFSYSFSTESIDAFVVSKSTRKATTWKKNHFTDQYEEHETGGTYTSTYFSMRRQKKSRRLVPQWSMSSSDVRRVAQQLGVDFYDAHQKPPALENKKGISWGKYIFAAFVLYYVVMIGHEEWRKYAVVGEARQAAKRIGIAVEPNLPNDKLAKGTLVLVYLEEVERWQVAQMIFDRFPPKKTFVSYVDSNGKTRHEIAQRSILRAYEEIPANNEREADRLDE